jgi:hypothetical protein
METPKPMISMFFSFRGFLATKFLPKSRIFNSDKMIVAILREMEARIQEDCPMKKLKQMIIHLYSARTHNSERAVSEIERLDLRRTADPPDDSDGLPCDFWLFGLVNFL